MLLCFVQNEWNILHHACAGGDLEMIQWLIEQMPELQNGDMLNQKAKVNYTEKY